MSLIKYTRLYNNKLFIYNSFWHVTENPVLITNFATVLLRRILTYAEEYYVETLTSKKNGIFEQTKYNILST
jgi:hypothetical protein